ncbi:MAG: ATP-binding cassette domain-containing protein [SAR324 cluster bacterium]|nr:ATP-binding cassette domain-containing protein [SAR324 cluster bacterium]
MNFSEPLLKIENLGRQLPNHWIWRNINFSIQAGAKVAVLGPSGSGKTLFLRVLAGLDNAQEGEIFFQGLSLSQWKMPQFRSQVIYLSQNPALLEGTVEKNLQYVYRFSIYRDQHYNRQRILDFLSLLGRSSSFLKRAVHELSGGESQIVVFLRALQLAPSLLFFDEPSASLDRESASGLETLVSTWQAENEQRSYFWTSHDPSQLDRMTDQELLLEGVDGK